MDASGEISGVPWWELKQLPANTLQKFFSRKSPLSTDQWKQPKKEDYLSASEVLGRPMAKNAAQAGKSGSDSLQEAYNAIVSGPDFAKTMEAINKSFRENPALTIGGPSGRATPGERAAVEMGKQQQNIFQKAYRPATAAEKLMHLDEGGYVSKGLGESGLNVNILGFSGSGAAPTDASGNIIPQVGEKSPEKGSAEWTQKVMEGTMPGVRGQSESEKSYWQSSLTANIAKQAAEKEMSKKKETQATGQTGPVADSKTPMPLEYTPFSKIMSQDQYAGGMSLLQTMGF